MAVPSIDRGSKKGRCCQTRRDQGTTIAGRTRSYPAGFRDAFCRTVWLLSNALGQSRPGAPRSEEHTSELQSPCNLVCRLLLEKKKINTPTHRDIMIFVGADGHRVSLHWWQETTLLQVLLLPDLRRLDSRHACTSPTL